MSKSPAFQFYPKDWLSDAKVKAMTLEARGAYIELLGIYWLEDGLPANSDRLARLIGVIPAKFRRLWPMIEPCFSVDGDRLRQKRMDRERASQEAYREAQRKRGLKGGKPRVINTDTNPEVSRIKAGSARPDESSPSAVSVLPSASANKQRRTDSGADDAPATPNAKSPEPNPPTTAALTVTVVAAPLPWNREAAELWFQEYRGDAPKQFFAEVKPLVAKYTWERVRPALVAYMAETQCKFVSLQKDFAGSFGRWEARARGQPETRVSDKARERDDGDLAMIRAGLKGGGHDGRGVDQGNGRTPVLAGAGRLERAEGDPGDGVPPRTRRAQ